MDSGRPGDTDGRTYGTDFVVTVLRGVLTLTSESAGYTKRLRNALCVAVFGYTPIKPLSLESHPPLLIGNLKGPLK